MGEAKKGMMMKESSLLTCSTVFVLLLALQVVSAQTGAAEA